MAQGLGLVWVGRRRAAAARPRLPLRPPAAALVPVLQGAIHGVALPRQDPERRHAGAVSGPMHVPGERQTNAGRLGAGLQEPSRHPPRRAAPRSPLPPPLASPLPPPQCNHRSWADFVVDMFITGARGVPLSRRVGAAHGACLATLRGSRSQPRATRRSREGSSLCACAAGEPPPASAHLPSSADACVPPAAGWPWAPAFPPSPRAC